MSIHSTDLLFMQKALKLAELGQFTTTPNPNVGCVIVKNGQIVGEGYHQKAGQPHAEVYAIQMAGEKAKNATAYVTLEPCSHFGKTPPCVEALILAGIKRVVIANQDPNPQVSGAGIKKLHQAGIEVQVGLCSDEAAQLNRGFFKRMKTGLPYIQLKLAVSLDGKIALDSGESKWITSPLARQDVQKFRAQACAILSTAKTVHTDNAQLTVRYHQLPSDIVPIYAIETLRQPVRILLDSKNRLTGNESIFQNEGETWVVRKTEQPIAEHPLIVEASNVNQIDLRSLFKMLGGKQLNTIWIESGGHLAGALIEQDLVDELVIYYAPKLLGTHAIDMCVLPKFEILNSVPSFNFKSIDKIGCDLRTILTKNK